MTQRSDSLWFWKFSVVITVASLYPKSVLVYAENVLEVYDGRQVVMGFADSS